ncbi:magnesium transporter [Granulicatella seriolae]|uniref:Magnesium transporter MgtE n=1 Tax=Granulicatella seriolae TaxID=2967226 RepID=A0ABT1WK80_9LACT|nr:magnesium transporter [Granulicatella seriolae]
MEEWIRQAVESKDAKKILELINQNYPIDIALGLENCDEETLKAFMFGISDKRLASILEVANVNTQRRMMENLPFRRVSSLFQHMSNDDIVDILGNLPVGIRKRYLNMMKQASQNEIRRMLDYDPQSAGGIMTTEFITVNEELTVEQAFYKIRDISPNTEVINTIFVTSKDNTLIGWLDIRDLFINKMTDTLQSIMHKNVISVLPEVDQEEVAQLSAKYDLSVVPVVNSRNKLLGIITIDDIMDVLQEEYHEDMLLMSGVQENEQIGGSFWDSLRRRTPWLVINLATAFLASAVIGLFQDTISQVVALAVAMPIITGMGGNSASQTLALVIQGIALGRINLKDDKKYVFKEISLGLTNGFITGLIAAICIYIPYQNFYLSLIVILAMMGNLVVGAIFGYFIPLILKHLNMDPALASTIFVTTATDVFGFFIFLSLAQLALPLIL